MFQSFYQTGSKQWTTPSNYLVDIEGLTLSECALDVTKYEIKLNEGYDRNREKMQQLVQLTQRWTDMLRKALSYLTSKRSQS